MMQIRGDGRLVPGKIGSKLLTIVPLVFCLKVFNRIAGHGTIVTIVIVGHKDTILKFIRAVKHVVITIKDEERAFIVSVVFLTGVIPAVVPDEVQVARQQRHHNRIHGTFFHADDSNTLAIFGGHADSGTFPAIATLVEKRESDRAFLTDQHGTIGGTADAVAVGHENGILVEARLQAIVVVAHGGAHLGIGQGDQFLVVAADAD